MTDGAASAEQAREIALLWIARSAPSPIEAATCDPTPRPPECGVTSAPVPVDPPGMSHKAPPAAVEVIGESHVLAALALCRASVERMALRTVTRGRALPVATAEGARRGAAHSRGDDPRGGGAAARG